MFIMQLRGRKLGSWDGHSQDVPREFQDESWRRNGRCRPTSWTNCWQRCSEPGMKGFLKFSLSSTADEMVANKNTLIQVQFTSSIKKVYTLLVSCVHYLFKVKRVSIIFFEFCLIFNFPLLINIYLFFSILLSFMLLEHFDQSYLFLGFKSS